MLKEVEGDPRLKDEGEHTINQAPACIAVHTMLHNRPPPQPPRDVSDRLCITAADKTALRVRCCALLTDLGQLDAALGCLEAAGIDLSRSSNGDRESGYGAPKRHYEAARARLRGIERAMRRGEEVVRSQVEVVANELRAVLSIDPQHKGALEYRDVLRATPPNGLGWDEEIR